METALDVLLDAFLDTVKLAPVLIVVYFLIELLEYKNVFKFEKSKLLNGKASPVVGALFGSIPQCGFSVISAELYSKQKISVAALVAVFMATSDEALPIMLSNYKSIPALLMLILVKIVIAIISGYITMFLYKVLFLKNAKKAAMALFSKTESSNVTSHIEEDVKQTQADCNQAEPSKNELDHDVISHEDHKNHNHEDHDEQHEHDHGEHIHACCNHDIENNKFNWKHPLVHSTKILIWIFAVNFVLGGVIALVGEENLISFLQTGTALQPLFAVIIGLIPNCASSVVLTELYLMGGLEFGAIVAGLSVNAGLGILVLSKENKNKKENFFILAVIIALSLIFGYALQFLPFDFLRI